MKNMASGLKRAIAKQVQKKIMKKSKLDPKKWGAVRCQHCGQYPNFNKHWQELSYRVTHKCQDAQNYIGTWLPTQPDCIYEWNLENEK